MELSNAFVIAMGMGIVFIGLVSLIFITMAMSACLKKFSAPKAAAKPASVLAAPAAASVPAAIPNRPEFIAACSAAIAEDMGEEVSALRIVSVKRV